MRNINHRKAKRWVKWFLPFYLFALLPVFVSCSESDGDDVDINEWKTENDQYFEKVYQSHVNSTATSFLLPKWSSASSLSAGELPHTDYIAVDVLESGINDGSSPYYTDSVLVHYGGRLIPSDDFPKGYEFDHSWLTTFDPAVDMPAQFNVDGLVLGFSTALQHMHRGDRWRVTIPYQLGYGTTTYSNVPAYSNLIFDIRLVDFWNKEEGDRD